jgi:eukaryotic-like serine/threonine-protein kinase
VVHAELPPLAERAPGVPLEVESVLRRALAKRPGDRFASVSACSRALEAAAAPPAAGAEKATPSGVRATPWIHPTPAGASLAGRLALMARTIMGLRVADGPGFLPPPPAPTPIRRWPALARVTAFFTRMPVTPPPAPPARTERAPPRRKLRWILAGLSVAAGAAWFLTASPTARWPLGSWRPFMSPVPQAPPALGSIR